MNKPKHFRFFSCSCSCSSSCFNFRSYLNFPVFFSPLFCAVQWQENNKFGLWTDENRWEFVNEKIFFEMARDVRSSSQRIMDINVFSLFNSQCVECNVCYWTEQLATENWVNEKLNTVLHHSSSLICLYLYCMLGSLLMNTMRKKEVTNLQL